MDKYLIEILKEQNTIIIPGLGALTLTNKETGEVMFMPFLKHDDGTLVNYIAQREGWEENEARNLIAKYVREIEAKLNVGDSYDMYQFGTFKKDGSGDTVFEKWIGTSEVVSEVVAEQPISENSVPNEISDKIEEQIEVQIEEEKIEEVQSDTEVLTADSQPEEVETTQEEEPEKKEEIQDEVESVYTEKQQWEDDLDVPPINATKPDIPKKPIIEKAQKDKKRKSPLFYAMITFFVIVIGGLTTIAIFYNDVKSHLPFLSSEPSVKTEAKVVEPEPENDPVESVETVNEFKEEVLIQEEEEEIVEDEVKEVVSKPEVKKVSKPMPKKMQSGESSLPFHVIVGSFGEEANANRFKSKLEGEGYSATVIGNVGGMYLVSLASYSTRNEAMSAAGSNNEKYPKSWVFKKP